MDEAIAWGQRLIVITHTCPWRELNGHPIRHNALDILSAYSGNSLIENVLISRSDSIDLHCCGHTHMPVSERILDGCRTLNIGADYGIFRAVTYHTVTHQICWIGEPIENAQPH